MARGVGGPRQPLSVKQPAKTSVAAKAIGRPATPAKPAHRSSKSRGQKLSQKAPLVAKSPRSKAAKQEVAQIVLERLRAEYPDAHCELDHANAFELLCATILSAQCTDVRVNMVTPSLFNRYPDAQRLADAELDDVEAIVRSTGFFRAKAKNLVAMAQALVEKHAGAVPRTIPELAALAGVGRKTANVILSNAFDINDGIVVDTHVQRLSRRLGLTREPDPIGIERELMPLFPRKAWGLLSHLLIWHGRRTCLARRPACASCPLLAICPSAEIPPYANSG